MSKSEKDEEDIIEFSDGLRKTYKPINNNDKFWKEMTALRKEWEADNAIKNPTPKQIIDVEEKSDRYYFRLCEIYYGMTRIEYDNLPPSETVAAVEAANYSTIHHTPFEGKALLKKWQNETK